MPTDHPMNRKELLQHWARAEGLLRRMLAAVETDLPADGVAEVREYLDHNELGLAMETLSFLVLKPIHTESR